MKPILQNNLIIYYSLIVTVIFCSITSCKTPGKMIGYNAYEASLNTQAPRPNKKQSKFELLTSLSNGEFETKKRDSLTIVNLSSLDILMISNLYEGDSFSLKNVSGKEFLATQTVQLNDTISLPFFYTRTPYFSFTNLTSKETWVVSGINKEDKLLVASIYSPFIKNIATKILMRDSAQLSSATAYDPRQPLQEGQAIQAVSMSKTEENKEPAIASESNETPVQTNVNANNENIKNTVSSDISSPENVESETSKDQVQGVQNETKIELSKNKELTESAKATSEITSVDIHQSNEQKNFQSTIENNSVVTENAMEQNMQHNDQIEKTEAAVAEPENTDIQNETKSTVIEPVESTEVSINETVKAESAKEPEIIKEDEAKGIEEKSAQSQNPSIENAKEVVSLQSEIKSDNTSDEPKATETVENIEVPITETAKTESIKEPEIKTSNKNQKSVEEEKEESTQPQNEEKISESQKPSEESLEEIIAVVPETANKTTENLSSKIETTSATQEQEINTTNEVVEPKIAEVEAVQPKVKNEIIENSNPSTTKADEQVKQMDTEPIALKPETEYIETKEEEEVKIETIAMNTPTEPTMTKKTTTNLSNTITEKNYAKGDIVFSVQLAASTTLLPKGSFHEIDGVIIEQNNTGWYTYIIGDYTDIKTAKEVQDKMRNKGIKDAWVVCYYKGQRVHIKEILEFLYN